MSKVLLYGLDASSDLNPDVDLNRHSSALILLEIVLLPQIVLLGMIIA
jgi:hypothetical protein